MIAARASTVTVGTVDGTSADTITRGSRVETVAYDGLGRVTSFNNGINTTSYGYDGAGRRTFVSFPGSSLGQSVAFDALNRPIR